MCSAPHHAGVFLVASVLLEFFACFLAVYCLLSLLVSVLACPRAYLGPCLLHLLLVCVLACSTSCFLRCCLGCCLGCFLPCSLTRLLASVLACLRSFFVASFLPFFFSLIYYLVACFRASLVARCQAHSLQSLLAFNCLRFFIVDPGPKGGLQIPQLAYQHRRTGRGRLGISRVSEAVANGAGPVGRGRLLRGTFENMWIHILYVRDST